MCGSHLFVPARVFLDIKERAVTCSTSLGAEAAIDRGLGKGNKKLVIFCASQLGVPWAGGQEGVLKRNLSVNGQIKKRDVKLMLRAVAPGQQQVGGERGQLQSAQPTICLCSKVISVRRLQRNETHTKGKVRPEINETQQE